VRGFGIITYIRDLHICSGFLRLSGMLCSGLLRTGKLRSAVHLFIDPASLPVLV